MMQTQRTDRVTVYTTKGCVQCQATCRTLDAKNIDYRSIVVAADDDDARDQLRALGFMQFPVVQVTGQPAWSGFRPDKIAEIHLDVSQAYRDGLFWTKCSCGREFSGNTPEDADAAAYDHCYPETLPSLQG